MSSAQSLCVLAEHRSMDRLRETEITCLQADNLVYLIPEKPHVFIVF